MSLITSLALVLALGSQAQTPPAQRPLPSPSPQVPAPSIADPNMPRADPAKLDQSARYVLGANDQLKITVFDEPDLSNVYRVDSDGFITFPMVNKVAASGLTAAELQERIKTMLVNYIKNPQVRVEVEGYKSQSVIVSGEVRAPGKVPMTGTMTLVEALAAAGSPTSSASNEISVSRQKRNADGTLISGSAVDIIRVNLKELQLGTAGRDIVLQDGDLVNVPKAQTFIVTGQVRNSGALIWDPGMTVQQAIALAGGLTDRGSDRRIVIERIQPDGKQPKKIGASLGDKVMPNDIITVNQRIF
jgi:polysaccharide export outer membrane protein